eukprot:TRINITY_DN18398_c0_g1_i1.p1 TRINITY_DN18398_c0_g1~~TRINITY_DN18398_c0_g1_i1.p1  ORF type:complete len:221 (+),score=69.10 TRINITY_DN18398_c0_g1_i1:42-704(+)
MLCLRRALRPAAAAAARGAARAPPSLAAASRRHKMSMADRILGVMYYEPVFADIGDERGLRNLITVESHKRAVVVVYHKAKDTLARELFERAASEHTLCEVNNRALYAFASASLDPTLPCAPVVDVYIRGECVMRTLGRSPMPIRGALPHLIAQAKLAGDPEATEEYPSHSTYGLSNKLGLYQKILSRLSKAPSKEVFASIEKEREALPYSAKGYEALKR